MKKLFIPIIVLIGIGLGAFAQEKSNKELKGDKYYFNYSFDKAIDRYNRAKQLSSEGQRKLAESYHNIDMNTQAEAAYLKLISAPGDVLPDDYYNYAMVLKMNGKYTEAVQWLDKYENLKPGDLRARDYKANKAGLADLQKDGNKYKVENLNVNSEALDFGTSYYKDKVVFASTREGSRMIVRRYNWTRKPFWDMYVADVSEGQLKNPVVFDEGLNAKWHDGPASFSKDGNYMAFTRNNYNHKGKDKIVELQIYFATFADGKWSKPEPFVLNNESYSVGHPFLTSNGNTMYFTSDMPGGFGGTDIYRITKDDKGVFGKAENLGDKINTEGDEMFPFLQELGNTLFFTSNGRYGLGGLDIFSCAASGTGFGPVSNAGAPVNTQYDDFALIANDNMSKGYLSSGRPGGSGGDDIYSVSFLDVADVGFYVNSPENIPVERRVRETFPLRNYIFFNSGSTEIPDRYILLKKDQVKDFKEDNLEVLTERDNSGRSDRQMVVYYNILNILGDRMGKNPATSINLVGASEKGPEDGKIMAETVKSYLVNIFGIAASRITVEGRDKPKIPSEQPGGTRELDLLRQGDQRVTVESSSPALLLEFQDGPDVPLKPVEIVDLDKAPPDSYVTFTVEGAEAQLNSWSLELKDESGKVQNFGPYTREVVSIPGKNILGERPVGDYKATMVGQSKNGKIIRKEVPVHMVLWTPSEKDEMMRFSIIYEFDVSDAIRIYEKYLTEIIIPKIPQGGKVIIHGHTDVIGDESYNQKLSYSRAKDVLDILKAGLSKAGRNDVKFEVYGFGEDLEFAKFNNTFPEERCYNRTVIIDIIPKL